MWIPKLWSCMVAHAVGIECSGASFGCTTCMLLGPASRPRLAAGASVKLTCADVPFFTNGSWKQMRSHRLSRMHFADWQR